MRDIRERGFDGERELVIKNMQSGYRAFMQEILASA